MVAVRRGVAAGAVVLLAGGLGLQPVPSAEAVVRAAELTAAEWVTVPSGCADDMTGSEPNRVDLPRDGRPHTVRLQRSGTVSNSAVSGTSVVTGTLTGDAWGSVRMGLAISSSVTARPRGGTICSLTYKLDSGVVADVTAPRPSWLVISAKGAVRSGGTAVVAASADSGAEHVVLPGRKLTRLVPAGGYAVGTRVTAQVAVPATSSTPPAVASSASVSGSLGLFPIGTLRQQSGKARAYLTAGHRDCAGRRVTMTLTPKAATKARRITLSVNGKRARVLTGKALRRTTVRLTKIPARSDGAISATVVTRSGAVRKMTARSWPCA
ncbi:hypothetical protein SAMN05421671_2097 [Pimelobacter simplex]|nr:hypothetical protein SAMN05421671_2097 [Pimelobacter simplex]